jgi:hypothetical protein
MTVREEFATRFHDATGVEWKEIETAIQEAVI